MSVYISISIRNILGVLFNGGKASLAAASLTNPIYPLLESICSNETIFNIST